MVETIANKNAMHPTNIIALMRMLGSTPKLKNPFDLAPYVASKSNKVIRNDAGASPDSVIRTFVMGFNIFTLLICIIQQGQAY
jgi:hypothetical protein